MLDRPSPVDATAIMTPASYLTGDPWWWRARPFPHIVATNVFVPHVRAAIDQAFEAIVSQARAGADSVRAHTFGAGFSIIPFAEPHKSQMPVMLTPEWHALLAQMVGLTVTGDVDGGLHHHETASPSGWVHNDLSPGWFEPHGGKAANLCDRTRTNYKTGQAYAAGATTVMRVRAATMIYFLGDGGWQDGDGGETGLYDSEFRPVATPSARVAPIQNSLLLFTVTPHSWHSFLSNSRRPRRSIILWLHEDWSAIEARWGSHCLVHWT